MRGRKKVENIKDILRWYEDGKSDLWNTCLINQLIYKDGLMCNNCRENLGFSNLTSSCYGSVQTIRVVVKE